MSYNMMKKYNNSLSFREHVRNYSKVFKEVCIEANSLFIEHKIANLNNKI